PPRRTDQQADPLAGRRDAGDGVPHRGERLARHAVLRHHPAGRTPDRQPRLARGGRDRRRQRLAAVLAGDPPLLKPIMLVVVLFSMIATFADFQLIYVLTRGGPYSSTHVFGTYAYEIAMRAAKLGQGASISLFLFPFLLVVIVLQLWYIRRSD